MTDDLSRLLEKSVVDEAGCWLWTGYVGPHGYGMFRLDGTMTQAHRASYRLLVGPIPEGLDLDHLCRIRHCVNPEHLEPVTRLENVRRGIGNGHETHCPQNHPYDEENTDHRSGNRRRCRTCHRDQERERARRRRRESV